MKDFETYLRTDQVGHALSDLHTGRAMGFLADAEIVHNEHVEQRIAQGCGDFTDLVANAAALNGIRKAILENDRGLINLMRQESDSLEVQGYSAAGAYRSIIEIAAKNVTEK
jgi:hypothetical protein